MANLFKLKKDDKTVGYMRICSATEFKTGCVEYAYKLTQKQWKLHFGKLWNKALPYVCDDKNGEKVFATDRVRRINGEPCFVKWFSDECRYILQNNQNCYELDIYEMQQGIELIKDKDNG